MNWDWKEWALAALIRAVKTFAQTAVSMIAVGAAFSEIDWLRVASVSGVAFLLSWLTSLAGISIPEVKRIEPDQQPPDDPEDTLPE